MAMQTKFERRKKLQKQAAVIRRSRTRTADPADPADPARSSAISSKNPSGVSMCPSTLCVCHFAPAADMLPNLAFHQEGFPASQRLWDSCTARYTARVPASPTKIAPRKIGRSLIRRFRSRGRGRRRQLKAKVDNGFGYEKLLQGGSIGFD
jgi:hypothetical protein